MNIDWRAASAGRWLQADSTTAEEVIASARLPMALAAAIGGVVKQTRLARAERRMVAHLLCQQARERLAAGCPADGVVAEFGEMGVLARQIGRQVRKGRSWAAKGFGLVLRGLVLAALVVAGMYASLFFRYNWARANVARNFAAEYTARVLARPAGELAWPRYRDAIVGWTHSKEIDELNLSGLKRLKPGEASWDDLVAHVRANAAALKAIRAAAELPGFGMLLETPPDAAAMAFVRWKAELLAGLVVNAGESNPPLISIFQTQLTVMRSLSNSLAFDAREAAWSGDGARATADINALMAMSRQLREPASTLSEVVRCWIAGDGIDTLGDVLALWPGVFDDGQLEQLRAALEMGGAEGSPFAVRVDFDRRCFEDLAQRMYSDNGSGDGIFLPAGFVVLDPWSVGTVHPIVKSLNNMVTGPILSGIIVGRKAAVGTFNEWLDCAEAVSATPLWQRTGAGERRLEEFNSFEAIRFMPVLVFVPLRGTDRILAEHTLQRRDAVLVALALEKYKRRTGAYPSTLDALVPELINAVPLDRYTGRPLCYLLRDGQPVVYSVGVDRVDDGGVLPVAGNNSATRWMSAADAADTAEQLRQSGTPSGWGGLRDIRGDWILWPDPAVVPSAKIENATGPMPGQ